MLKRISTPGTVLLVLLCISFTTTRADLQPGDLVAICGDSITEQKQYSVFVQTYLLACRPQADLRAMQFGWGGEVSWGFLNRMEQDVLRFKPTVATTCYGMNDGGYGPLADERAARYRAALEQIVKQFKVAGVRIIVVGSSGVVDNDAYRKDPAAAEAYNHTLEQLRDIAKDVAAREGVAFADVYSIMSEVMARAKQKYGDAYHVAGADGVHPAANGHLVMAYAFLRALGCNGEIGTVSVDLAGKRATASDGHKIIESSDGTIEMLSERYPFCFVGDPSSPDATRGIIEFLPFNQDLNRFVLVVRNAPETAARLTVTWGNTTREFSRERLEKGINLPAEFLDNPFSEPFKSVEQAVRQQQNFETPMIKQFIHNVPMFREMVPGETDALEQIGEAMISRHQELQRAARQSVRPVRHTIVVEVVK